MKKALKRSGHKLTGWHDGLHGTPSPYLSGDVSGLRGYVSGLSGDVSGLRGDVSGLSGDVDDCDISPEDRQCGINISDLIAE